MLYTWMFVALVAFSSLNKVTMQDSSMLPSGHSNCSSAKKPVTSPVWCSNLLRYWVRVDVLPDLLDGLDVLLIHASHAAGREAGGQVEQQGGDKQIGRERDQMVVRTWNPLPDSLKRVGIVEGFKIGYDEWVGGGGRVGD